MLTIIGGYGIFFQSYGPYQHYTMNRRKTSSDGGWRRIQPKYEFWTTVDIDGVEHRPVYYWKEGTEFYHAGERVHPLLQRYLDKLNRDFKLEGRNKLNSLMFIVDDQGWQHAPPHADGHRTGGFYDLSLCSPGYAREMQLLAPDAEPDWSKVRESQVLARKRLAHASLTVISAEDNGYSDADGAKHPPLVKHGVPPDETQPVGAWRICVVARAITPHIITRCPVHVRCMSVLMVHLDVVVPSRAEACKRTVELRTSCLESRLFHVGSRLQTQNVIRSLVEDPFAARHVAVVERLRRFQQTDAIMHAEVIEDHRKHTSVSNVLPITPRLRTRRVCTIFT